MELRGKAENIVDYLFILCCEGRRGEGSSLQQQRPAEQ